MAAALAICPQESLAEGFTGAEFLSWSQAQQRSYVNAQLVMASSIVARAKPDMSQCLADHFYGEQGVTDEQFDALRKTIEDYETYHPSSVLVIVIENTCGTFY